MQISINITFAGEPSKDEIVEAIREAASRASGQLEYDIVGIPEVDEEITLMTDTDLPAVESATLFRSE